MSEDTPERPDHGWQLRKDVRGVEQRRDAVEQLRLKQNIDEAAALTQTHPSELPDQIVHHQPPCNLRKQGGSCL